MLYILITGTPPFGGNSETEILEKVKKGQARFKEKAWERVSPHAKRVTKWMLTVEPERRPSA